MSISCIRRGIAQRPRQKDDRDQSGRDDGEGRDGAFFELIERSEGEHARGQRLEIERPEDQRRRQFLHAVDEDQQSCRHERRPQDRQMHLEKGGEGASSERARCSRDIGRHPLQARFRASRRRYGQKAHDIG